MAVELKNVVVEAAESFVTNGSDYDREKEVNEFQETKAGVKGLVDSGIVKIPRFFIHSPENLPKEEELRASSPPFPVIDLEGVYNSDRRKLIVDEVRIVLQSWGSFQMVNHGIPVSILDDMIQGVKQFHEQPTEVKKEMYANDSTYKVRYFSNGKLFGSQPLNWKDTLACSLDEDQLDFGEVPIDCRNIMIEYVKRIIRLKQTLSELFSEALGLSPNYFESIECMKIDQLLGHYYPACPQPELTLGATRHSDPGFLTILLQDGTGGLQVLDQQQWVAVPPIHGALVAYIGDLLQLMTNDKFKSVEHRVLAVRAGPRISVPAFFFPRSHEPKPYGPIKELLSEHNPPPPYTVKPQSLNIWHSTC